MEYDNNKLVKEFLEQLDDSQKKALEIAQDHLESSFDITKCNAFKDYLNSKK